MSGITTHVLDTSRGKPASGVEVVLERAGERGAWMRVGSATTDSNGRVAGFPGAGPIGAGTYRLTFGVAEYFVGKGAGTFFPTVEITFVVSSPEEHHHVPLLVSPFGYSTYRGS